MVKRAKVEAKTLKGKLPPIRCRGCGINFVPKDRREHYHSDTCRETYYQRVYFAKIQVNKTCPNCGADFVTSKPGRQNYCSPECRDDARKKRLEGIAASVNAERATFMGDRFATLERNGFKCVHCGRGAHDGARLNVEDDGKGKLQTICDMCAEGQRFNAALVQEKLEKKI